MTKIDAYQKYFCKLQTNVLRPDRRAADNSTLAIGGVSSPLDSFVVAESSVLRINICGKNRQLLIAAKRYSQC